MAMNLAFWGDLCPIGALSGPALTIDTVFSDRMISLIQSVDANVFNLECPLTDSEARIKKSGPHLKANPGSSNTITKMGLQIACLANNHIMDYSSTGLVDTISQLDHAGIKWLGAGMNSEDAAKPLILEHLGVTVALINCCEEEFSIADTTKPGANIMDAVRRYHDIQKAKEKADHVIMICHSGVENYSYPTPKQIELYRFFVSSGASAVVGHHSHCMQPYEVFNDAPIFYSLGNFIFDETGNPDTWSKGMGVVFDVGKDKLSIKAIVKMQVRYDPLKVQSSIVTNDSKHGDFSYQEAMDNWERLCSNQDLARSYINSLTCTGFFERILNKVFRSRLSRRTGYSQLNIIRNGSLHEILVKTYINQLERKQ